MAVIVIVMSDILICMLYLAARWMIGIHKSKGMNDA